MYVDETSTVRFNSITLASYSDDVDSAMTTIDNGRSLICVGTNTLQLFTLHG